MVAAGHDLMTRDGARWSTDRPIHGAAFVGDRLWVAVDGAAVQVDPTTGAERHRVTIPAGVTLRGALTR
jgi:hypothetical protein